MIHPSIVKIFMFFTNELASKIISQIVFYSAKFSKFDVPMRRSSAKNKRKTLTSSNSAKSRKLWHRYQIMQYTPLAATLQCHALNIYSSYIRICLVAIYISRMRWWKICGNTCKSCIVVKCSIRIWKERKQRRGLHFVLLKHTTQGNMYLANIFLSLLVQVEWFEWPNIK